MKPRHTKRGSGFKLIRFGAKKKMKRVRNTMHDHATASFLPFEFLVELGFSLVATMLD